MELDLDNKEWQDALQIINYTRRSLFLTGKAGTGKSTFLRYVASHTKKKHVILAPTGIAAINAGGSTLHSFFRLPFHPLLPNDSRYSYRHIKETLKYTGAQRKLIREVELIIIDEISMVRADIIDFIDKVPSCPSSSVKSTDRPTTSSSPSSTASATTPPPPPISQPSIRELFRGVWSME